MSNLHGIRLGLAILPSGIQRYRTRTSGGLTLSAIAGLDREWLDAYVAWHQERGELAEARALRQAWLASAKVAPLSTEDLLQIMAETQGRAA